MNVGTFHLMLFACVEPDGSQPLPSVLLKVWIFLNKVMNIELAWQ